MFKTEKNQKKYKFSFLTSKYKGKLKNRPIPSLNDTKKSFVKFIKPFLDNKSDTEFHEELINDFIKDEGNSLQKRLVELSKVIPSWHYDLMLENFHLKNKKPIPFFSNYFIVYDLNFKDQIDAFAKIILSSMFLKRMIKDEKISELTMKDYTQYFCLFHSCRIPNYEVSAGARNGENSGKEDLEKNKNIDLEVKIDFEDKKEDKKRVNEKETKAKSSGNRNDQGQKQNNFKSNLQKLESNQDLKIMYDGITYNDKNELKNKNELKAKDSKEVNFNEIDAINKKNLQIKSKTKSSPKTLSDPLSRENSPRSKEEPNIPFVASEKNNHQFLINQKQKIKNNFPNNSIIKESLNIFDYDENKFVVVLYKNIFWLVETSLDYEHLSEQMLYITSLDLSEKQENFIGVLTGSNRDHWAKARHKFFKISPKNKNFIFYIERSMMIFCLCDCIYERTEYQELYNNIWFNDLNNRFFDKVLQVIIFKDGTVCLNIEKSAVDISVAVEFLKFVRNLNANEQMMQKIFKKQILGANPGTSYPSSTINGNIKNANNISNSMKIDPIKTNFHFGVETNKNNKGSKLKSKSLTKAYDAKNAKNDKKPKINFLDKAENLNYLKDELEEKETFNLNRIIGNTNYFENFNNKPVRLNYDLTEKLKAQINSTAKNFRKEVAEKISSEIFIFKDFGKLIFEKKGVDMVSFIQLAVLSAHYRTYGKIVASRQFICGRNFRFGIVEFVRTTVKESVNFIVSLNELRIPRDLKVKLGQDFFKENKKNINDVLNGKSFDVHFAGMNFVKKKSERKNSGNENNGHVKSNRKSSNNSETKRKNSNIYANQKEKELNNKISLNPEEILNNGKNNKDFDEYEENENVIKEKSTIEKILNDEIFAKASDFVIETYPLTNEHVKLCLQGYVNEIDGLSITYIARKDHIQFNFVSANDLKKFIQSLEEILYEMKDLFLEKGREMNPKF